MPGTIENAMGNPKQLQKDVFAAAQTEHKGCPRNGIALVPGYPSLGAALLANQLVCICRALEEVSGLKGVRIKGCTGVWVNNHKVAAIGVRAQRWVTYHGLALNVTTDLQPFQLIVLCGISSRGVTSIAQLLQSEGIPDQELLREYQFGLLDAFADVFDVVLTEAEHTLS